MGMIDREMLENVTKGLKCRSERHKSYDCQTCKYGFFDGVVWCCDIPSICKDALALLKGDEEATCGPDYYEIEFQEGGGSDA